jgi:hypothetical protein
LLKPWLYYCLARGARWRTRMLIIIIILKYTSYLAISHYILATIILSVLAVGNAHVFTPINTQLLSFFSPEDK